MKYRVRLNFYTRALLASLCTGTILFVGREERIEGERQHIGLKFCPRVCGGSRITSEASVIPLRSIPAPTGKPPP